MTQERQYIANLSWQATHDALTGLPNRRAFERRLHDAISNARAAGSAAAPRTLSVAFCDIDHFKAINDEHGHAAGDAALTELAGVLRATVRSSDVVGRWGGEEFLLVLVETRAAEASPLLERLRKKIGQLAFNVGGDTQIPITASTAPAISATWIRLKRCPGRSMRRAVPARS